MRVLIADDEALARRRLRRLLGACADVEVVDEVSTGVEVLQRIATTKFDAVFLDIQMPGLTGIEAMRLWPAGGPAIVFVTAHSEHAVAAFEGDVVDYLLKPFDAKRLQTTIGRLRQRLAAVPQPEEATLERLALGTRKGIILLHPETIACAIIDGESVVVHGDRGQWITDMRLADLERKLAGHGFERVHRRALVNLSRIERLEPTASGGYLAHTDVGAVVPVSRQSARALRKRWRLG